MQQSYKIDILDGPMCSMPFEFTFAHSDIEIWSKLDNHGEGDFRDERIKSKLDLQVAASGFDFFQPANSRTLLVRTLVPEQGGQRQESVDCCLVEFIELEEDIFVRVFAEAAFFQFPWRLVKGGIEATHQQVIHAQCLREFVAERQYGRTKSKFKVARWEGANHSPFYCLD
ncbi:hypothetical protein AB9E06_05915 [Rhizobium leguminosarum]|uniref:hypothetical protein n=1 Tax=Rhizobium leguminosarum TaxID=384 RepID=UPI003F995B6C